MWKVESKLKGSIFIQNCFEFNKYQVIIPREEGTLRMRTEKMRGEMRIP